MAGLVRPGKRRPKSVPGRQLNAVGPRNRQRKVPSEARSLPSRTGRANLQATMLNSALTLVGDNRTTSSPGIPLRRPNSSARCAPT